MGRLARGFELRILRKASHIFGVTEKVSDSVRSITGREVTTNYLGMDLQPWREFKDKTNLLIASATWDFNRDPSKYLGIIANLPGFNLLVLGRWRVKAERG